MDYRAPLAVLLAICLRPLFGGEANAVPNPGFEDGPLTQPVGWSVPERAGCRFAVDDAVAHSGQRSIRADGLDAAQQDRFVQAWRVNVPLPAAGPVWLTGWVRGQDLTAGRVNVLHQDKDGKVLLNQGIASFAGTFAWREFGAPLETVPGTVSVQLVLGIQKSTGTIWFDDLCVGPREAANTVALALTPSNQHPAHGTLPAVFTFTLGNAGLQPGGEVALQWDNWRTCREFAIEKPRAECSIAGTALTLTRPPRKKSWPPTPKPVDTVVALAGDQPLPAGTEIRVHCQLRFAKFTNVQAALFGTLSPSAGALASRTPLIQLEPQGGQASQLVCLAEPRPLIGQPGRVTVALTDAAGNPADGFTGTIHFAPTPGMKLPTDYTFTAEDGGSHDFLLVSPADRVTRLVVRSGDLSATSNPILPRTAAEPGIYFGDIHSHCELSADAVGDPDAAYDYAKRFNGLDFAGLSDHSPHNDRWQQAMAVSLKHDEPGRFVTMLGFEWSSSALGHRNAYYPGAEGPEQPGLPDNTKAWFDFLAEGNVEAVIVPHHTNTEAAQILANGQPAWSRCDWSVINHRYQRVVEICQNRGSFEAPGGPIPELRIARKDVGASVQTALAMGHRLGFIGSTDTHSGRPGNGLARAAMVTTDLTRRGLWQALHDRSCYATTGPHTLVFLTLNNAPMGSELTLPAGTARQLSWRVVGTTDIQRVDLLCSNEVVQSWTGEGDDMRGTFARAETVTATEWWYLRVLQTDTNLAWSSPIWVDPAKD